MTKSKLLSILYHNVQSITSKKDILTTEFNMFGNIAFTETWLSTNINSSKLEIPSFHNSERVDRRIDGYGGGIMYVKDTLHYRGSPEFENPSLDCLWVRVMPSHSNQILISDLYHPPNSHINYMNRIDHFLKSAIDCGISDVIVIGNFNLSQPSPLSHTAYYIMSTVQFETTYS